MKTEKRVIKTVSTFVAVLVLEHLKQHNVPLNVVEFEQDEVFLTDGNGAVIRISRTGPLTGEIVFESGTDRVKDLIENASIQSYKDLFELPVV